MRADASDKKVDRSLRSPDISDPFSGGHMTFSTNGVDTFPSPSAYLTRRHAWVHIFPEGMIHQKEDKTMRYFKWGVSRLILESDPLPDIVPMWIEGPQEIMDEARTFPRFLPRPDGLKYSAEAVELRKECTLRVRAAVLDVRRLRGHADEDPKAGLADTWKREGPTRQGPKDDGSRTREE